VKRRLLDAAALVPLELALPDMRLDHSSLTWRGFVPPSKSDDRVRFPFARLG